MLMTLISVKFLFLSSGIEGLMNENESVLNYFKISFFFLSFFVCAYSPFKLANDVKMFPACCSVSHRLCIDVGIYAPTQPTDVSLHGKSRH